ncbi:uncharacterized protein EV422DRAFT_508089 [Fimicolochytrium jonesii]|uniref:uncharacterized protein n=1 Tax=Fimicolochytrium jonesii TaxID=1396493 RepID=UPI0022FE124F|nr:uncharacterized protein EV422DRAFT_508089 [Fimicolochytrium jonesii]KAI8818570.1 hypothetical protein EV422DRAFT_508089 [Fimicolochytrium jonesii]
MHYSAVLTILAVLSCLLYRVEACGCYGPQSCTLKNDRCNGQPASSIIATLTALETSAASLDPRADAAGKDDQCVCDCCAVCNTCSALFSGCGADNIETDIRFRPSLKPLQLNKPIKPLTITRKGNTTENLGLWGELCVDGNLPKGLEFAYNAEDQTFVLQGTPVEKARKEPVVVIAKAGGGVLQKLKFKVTVK